MTQSVEHSMKTVVHLRALRQWNDIVAFVRGLPPSVAEAEAIQQQLGFSLNRAGAGGEAESTLKRLLLHPGDHSETLGILGRIYKDRWEQASRTHPVEAARHLSEAIDTYARGFAMNQDNAYPGINLATLLTIRNPADPRIPDVCKAVERAVGVRLRAGTTDYFDHATKVELSVLLNQPDGARRPLDIALGKVREPWEPETTAHNLHLIRTSREARGEKLPWVSQIEDVLLARAGISGTQFTSAHA